MSAYETTLRKVSIKGRARNPTKNRQSKMSGNYGRIPPAGFSVSKKKGVNRKFAFTAVISRILFCVAVSVLSERYFPKKKVRFCISNKTTKQKQKINRKIMLCHAL